MIEKHGVSESPAARELEEPAASPRARKRGGGQFTRSTTSLQRTRKKDAKKETVDVSAQGRRTSSSGLERHKKRASADLSRGAAAQSTVAETERSWGPPEMGRKQREDLAVRSQVKGSGGMGRVAEYAARCALAPLPAERGSEQWQVTHAVELMADSAAALRRVLPMDEPSFYAALRRAEGSARFVGAEMRTRVKNIRRHPCYARDAWASDASHAAWERAELRQLEGIVALVEAGREAAGTLVVRLGGAAVQRPLDRPEVWVMAQVGARQQRTRAVASVEPEWRHAVFAFELDRAPEDAGDDEALVISAASGEGRATVALGDLPIPLAKLRAGRTAHRWFQLRPPAGSKDETSQCKVELTVLYVANSAGAGEAEWDTLDAVVRRDVEAAAMVSHNDSFRLLAFNLIEDGLAHLPGPLLSDRARWLLAEYRRRYRVGEAFACLTLLDLLSCSMANLTPAHLEAILEQLIEMQALGDEDLPTAELRLKTAVYLRLKTGFESMVRTLDESFRASPPGTLRTVVNILSFLTGSHDSGAVSAALGRLVESFAELQYASFLLRAAAGKCYDHTLTAAAGFIPPLVAMCDAQYADEMPPDVRLGPRLEAALYARLRADVLKAVEGRTEDVSEWTVALYLKLRDLHAALMHVSISKAPLLPLRELFAPLLARWPAQFKAVGLAWVNDTVAPNAPRGASQQLWVPIGRANALHSAHAVAFVNRILDARSSFARLDDAVAPDEKAFERAVLEVLVCYCESMQASCVRFLSERAHKSSAAALDFSQYVALAADGPASAAASSPPELLVPPVLCVKLNDFRWIERELIREFAAGGPRMRDDAVTPLVIVQEDTFASLSAQTDASLRAGLGAAVEALGRPSSSKSKRGMEPKVAVTRATVARALEPLMAYLTVQLMQLSGRLYFESFRMLMRLVWSALMAALFDLLVPQIDDVLDRGWDSSGVSLLAEMAGDIIDVVGEMFLSAEGAGVEAEDLRPAGDGARAVLRLRGETTPRLIDRYRQLEDDAERAAAAAMVEGRGRKAKAAEVESPFAITGAVILSLLAQRKDDVEARRFVEANKSAARSAMVQRKFGLPSKEIALQSFKCTDVMLRSGVLWVTSSYAAFEPSTLFGAGRGRLVLALGDVVAVKKKRMAKLFDSGLRLTMASGAHHLMSGFFSRNAAFDLMVTQARKIHGADVRVAGREAVFQPVLYDKLQLKEEAEVEEGNSRNGRAGRSAEPEEKAKRRRRRKDDEKVEDEKADDSKADGKSASAPKKEAVPEVKEKKRRLTKEEKAQQRQEKRNAKLVKYFKVEDGTAFVDKHHAVWCRGSARTGGKLYLMSSGVAFRSTMNTADQAILPYSSVRTISRGKSGMIIPDAVRFQLEDGSEVNFSGIFARDDVYKQVTTAWRNAHRGEVVVATDKNSVTLNKKKKVR